MEPGAIVGAFGAAVVRVHVLDELGAWQIMLHRPRGPGRDLLLLKRPRDAKVRRVRQVMAGRAGALQEMDPGPGRNLPPLRLLPDQCIPRIFGRPSGGTPVTAAIIPEPTNSHHGNTAHAAKT